MLITRPTITKCETEFVCREHEKGRIPAFGTEEEEGKLQRFHSNKWPPWFKFAFFHRFPPHLVHSRYHPSLFPNISLPLSLCYFLLTMNISPTKSRRVVYLIFERSRYFIFILGTLYTSLINPPRERNLSRSFPSRQGRRKRRKLRVCMGF